MKRRLFLRLIGAVLAAVTGSSVSISTSIKPAPKVLTESMRYRSAMPFRFSAVPFSGPESIKLLSAAIDGYVLETWGGWQNMPPYNARLDSSN